MRFLKAFRWIFVAGLLLAAWGVFPAAAHALLVRSNPASNAVLASGPAQVELYFSESIEPGLSSVRVYDSNALQVDQGDTRVDSNDPTRLAVSLRSLTDGVYTVSWEVVSAADGHQTSGSFPFAVGAASQAALPAQSATTTIQLPASALVAKWLALASLALLVGQFSFSAWVWQPVLAAAGDQLPADFRRPSAWALINRLSLLGLALALLLNLLSTAGQAQGAELAWPWSPAVTSLLVNSRLGLVWLACLGLALAEVGLLWGRPSVWKQAAAFAIGLGLLFSLSLTSHAAADSQPFSLPADWLHAVGVSLWMGGLPYFLGGLFALRPVEETARTRLVSLCLRRFSALALASVAVIALSGLYAAILRVGSLPALFASLYGQTLVFKLLLFGLILLVAAGNLLVISPRLAQASRSGRADLPLLYRFERAVLAEIVLGGLLLASVGVLTYLPPAQAPAPAGLRNTTRVDDLQIDLQITPGRVGQNTFAVHLSSNGQPVEVVKELLLRFTPSQQNVAPSQAQLLSVGGGDYAIQGSFLSLPGSWQVQAVVRRENQFDSYADFDFSLSRPGAAQENPLSPYLAGGLAGLDGLLCLAAFYPAWRRGPWPRRAASFGLGLLLAAAGAAWLLHPQTPANAQANPIPPNAQSVTAGQALFQERCAPCHGAGGKGDGPIGLTMLPHPADLTQHAVPGVHTDFQLYDWITNGFAGTRMPAFKQILSDTDRWNLVNFIRTLAPRP